MIVHEGRKYRGISLREGAFRFRYTDSEGCEHRVKCETLDEALSLYHTKKNMRGKGGMPAPVVLRRGKLRVAEIVDDALAYSKATKRSYRTDVPRLASLKEWFGKRFAEALTPQEIEETLSDKAKREYWAPSTFNHYRSLASLAYRLAIRNRKATMNPARFVSRRREDNSRVRFLSEDEEKRLRSVLEAEFPVHLPEFDLALNTGLRQGNQYGLTWDMVDWAARMLHIARTKNELPLHVPLNDAALVALGVARSRTGGVGRVFLSARTGEPLEHPRHWFEPALRKAKIADFRWHDLRHTFASRLRMNGTPLEDISDLLGHKSLMMARRYAHLGPNRLHEVVASLAKVGRIKSGSKSGTAENGQQTGRPQQYVN